MIGAAGVAASLADLLAARIRVELEALAVEPGPAVPGSDEPVPPELDAMPHLVTNVPLPPGAVRIEDWPFLVVIAGRLLSLQAVQRDRDAGTTIYNARYSAQVVSWARGDGYAYTQAVRDRLVLGVRQTLLHFPRLDGSAFSIDLNTLTEDYAPTGVDDDITDGTFVAAASTRLELTGTETLASDAPSYVVEGIDVAVDVLPRRVPSAPDTP